LLQPAPVGLLHCPAPGVPGAQQMSLPVQVPLGLSCGHWAELPVHVSATSQGLAAGRQTNEEGRNWSGGQAAELPVHVSATSHGPAAGRQTKPAGLS
jgi:hypothetical protein